MKKVFKLTDEKKHPDRLLESIKNEIRKYIKREKKKTLADAKMTYWDFDCKVGDSQESAKIVDFDKLIKAVDEVKASEAKECYVEILAKVVPKPIKEETIETDEVE